MSNNFETNENFIEARYLSETNQYDLELMVAAPNIVDFGSGSASSNLATNQTIIEATAGPNRTGLPGCPRLDQLTLVWDWNKNIAVAKAVEFVTTKDFIYFPRTQTVHKVSGADIVLRQRCYYLQSKNNAEIIASGTQPMIQTEKDEKGLAIQNLAKNSKLMTSINRVCVQSSLKQRVFVGESDCVRISLEDGFKYPCGTNPEHLFELHNIKPFGDLEIV